MHGLRRLIALQLRFRGTDICYRIVGADERRLLFSFKKSVK